MAGNTIIIVAIVLEDRAMRLVVVGTAMGMSIYRDREHLGIRLDSVSLVHGCVARIWLVSRKTLTMSFTYDIGVSLVV